MTSTASLGQALLVLLVTTFASISAHAGDVDARSLAASFNASGHDLLKKFVAAPRNVVFSPYSIGAAMAMVSSGAEGDTATEMASVLHQRLDHDRADAANADILAILREHGTPAAAAPATRQSASLVVANALVLTRDAVVLDAYVKRLKQDYAAEVLRNARLDEVNNWVKHATEGKIKRILDQPVEKGIVVLDAVYFKQAWRSPFFADATRNDDFHVSPKSAIKVATMHQRGYFPVVSRPGFRAIRLSYSTEALSMVIVLPDAVDGATALTQRLDASELAKLFVMLRGREVYTDLSLPRFKTSFTAKLKSNYQQLGLMRPFDEDRADFSRIGGSLKQGVKLWIQDILHQATLEVTEGGSEAAAATSTSLVQITSASGQVAPVPEPFTVDRPFLFYIADDNTGAILFAGRLNDPTKMN